MGWREDLHETLDGRASCESVAKILLNGANLRGQARHLAVRVAAARPPWYVTSMAEDWYRGIADPGPQLRAAEALFGYQPGTFAGATPDALRVTVGILGGSLPGGWKPGSDWKADRVTRAEIRAGAPLLSRRQYNRRVRVLRRLADKAAAIERAELLRRLTLAGRGGFAAEIGLDRFCGDERAAAFVAYWVARKSRRRAFTLESRENPMDALAEVLLARCVARGKFTDWAMIACVYPDPQVLFRLDDAQRGELAGKWWQLMADAAMVLAGAWPDDVNRLTMIVGRGMDSSTWNLVATAYNAARAGWLNVTTAAGGAGLLEAMCPPKAMRLMAADLAYWHRASGSQVDPDTAVWASLPFPWDVVAGAETCTRAMVEAACRQHDVDPVARGWTAPRAKGQVADWVPTPELVHGVQVASPQWAAVLRAAGVFGMAGKAKADAGPLKAAAMAQGMVTGPLPVYDKASGAYLGQTGEGS